MSRSQFARGGPEQAAVGAAVSIIDACSASDGIGPLPGLTSALVRDVITPYLGSQATQVPKTAG